MSLDEHTLRVVARWLWLRAGVWEKRFQETHPTDYEQRRIAEEIENCGEFVREHGDLQRTRREKARRCEDCKHSFAYGSYCGHRSTWSLSEAERLEKDGYCGPSGKLWEAK